MRKTYIFLLIFTAVFLQCNSQNLLTPEWKFQTGDSLQWADAAYNDGHWKEITAGIPWERQGYGGYDGFAWYRKSVFIPSSLKKQVIGGGGLVLTLGRIDDADYTYWNGELVATSGDLPPTYVSAFHKERKCIIPPEKIRWNAFNVIAVRVYDGGGEGGMYTKNVELKPAGVEDFLVISPSFRRQDRIVTGKGPFPIPLAVSNTSGRKIDGIVNIKVKTEFGEPVFSASEKVSLPGKQKRTISIAAGDLAPGFYSAEVSLVSSVANKQEGFNFGINPENIVSPVDRMPDFDEYWRRAKKELAAVEPQFRIIRLDSLCTPKREWFLVEMRSLGNVLIRGWYGRPVRPGKYPAILHVQGYSSYMIPQWAYQGDDMVSFALNIRGHGNSKDNVNPGFPGYLLFQLHDKENYIYRGAYMDCIRAVDFLCSRPEVDTARIAVEGGSQGGALTFATAALDNQRIKVAVPQVPFLSDFRDYFRCATWPANEFEAYVRQHPEMGWDKVFETLSYIDIKNLAPWVRCPVLMAVGLMDNVCPPHINFAAYNQLNVPKEYIAYPESGHGLPSEFQERKISFIRKVFGLE